MTPRHLLAPARLAGSRLLATQSDERLVDLLRAGSESAFEAIVSRYRGPLLRYCSALLGRERAEDAVQQTFVKAYEAMQQDERPLLLRPWLYRIAHNTAHNALRDRFLRYEPLGDEGLAAERPELVLERQEELRSVLASVEALPPRQRDALVLRELEGRSYEEISAALGVGGGAVRQLLNRARTTLRTAATAITPVGLLLRLPTAGSGAGESVAARVAEMTGAAGAGAVVSKVAATALVTGAVAGGAAVAPLGESDGTPTPRGGAAEARDERRGGEQPGAFATPPPGAMAPAASEVPTEVLSGAGRGRSGDGRGKGHDGGGRGDSSGPGGGGSGHGDGSGGSNSGPGSGSGSGSSGSGSSGSGSSGSGSSGSGSSGTGSSGSGSSGSGSSGSGSSGTGSSGSGASGSGASGSGSGNATSGSGSSGSGSSDGGSGSGSESLGSAASGSGTSGSGSGDAASASGSSGSGSSGSGSGSGSSGGGVDGQAEGGGSS